MKTPVKSRAYTLKLAALAAASAVALLCLAALTAPSAAAPPPAGAITVRAGNYIGTVTTETFTLKEQVFTGSTDCSSGGGPVVTVTGVDQATGHSIPLAPTDSVLLTVPISPVAGGAFSDHFSEQNGPFVSWSTDPGSTSLASYPPGVGLICARGPADAAPHDFVANFYAGIELFDSCGNERYLYRPGEAVTIRVTGSVTSLSEKPRLIAAGGSANECAFVPPAPDFTTINTTTDPFVYTFTLPSTPADIPASCVSGGTTQVTGNWRVVTYDVPGCGCNRNTIPFQVQADAPTPSCPLDCPADVEQAAGASCGANVNFTPPAGAGVNCDHAPGSFFPVGTTTVTCTGPGGSECSFDVTVTDNTPPTITAPANINAGTDADSCSASGINPGTPTVSDNCAVNFHGTRSDAQALNAPYPLGTTTINWTATDASGHTASAQQTVTVVDDDAPNVSGVAADPSVLWPPNHSMRDVALTYTATDNCGAVSCAVSGVTSNEPANGTGDGDTAPDFEIVGPTLVRLRAERSGSGNGRTYTVTVTCSDGINSASKSVAVNVPKSQKK
ncbi:MAG: HYR domain-containing protein [Acidobacteria bacterium]|nr:HYR domain-containing protein [Acidobacteriota bacterium]